MKRSHDYDREQALKVQTCTRCGVEKPWAEFTMGNGHWGLAQRCKPCQHEVYRQDRAKRTPATNAVPAVHQPSLPTLPQLDFAALFQTTAPSDDTRVIELLLDAQLQLFDRILASRGRPQ